MSWSQPFIHHLITGLDESVRNVIACNRTENLDRFPIEEVVRFPNRYLIEPRLAVLAARHVQSVWNPDLIHAHFGWSGLRMMLLKQFLRVPLVVTFGGRDAGVQMQLPYFDRLYEVLLGMTEQVVCVSEDLKRKLVAAGAEPDRVRVIYRGANVDRFAFVDRSERPADAPVTALMVGRLVEKKGHLYAFKALRELVRRKRDVRLVVVGEGEDYPKIRRSRRFLGLQNRIDFVGSTDHAGVRQHMAEADFLLHSAITPESGDTEGIPNVVVEAQAMGLPVVGTEHGGIVEAVRTGETGLLVPERDVAALADAMETLVVDRARRLDMGRAARAFVERDFSMVSQIAEHLDIYRKLVAEAAANPSRHQRMAIPEDFGELVRASIQNHEEFSIAELLERLIWVTRKETAFVEAEDRESRLERLYNLKRHVPQLLKYPVKMAIARTLAQAIEARYRGAYREEIESLEGIDERVLAYFRAGHLLDDGSEAWRELESVIQGQPRVGERVITRSVGEDGVADRAWRGEDD